MTVTWRDHLGAIFDGSKVNIETTEDSIPGIVDALLPQLVEIGMPEGLARALLDSIVDESGSHAITPAARTTAQIQALSYFIVGVRLGRNPTPLQVPDLPGESA